METSQLLIALAVVAVVYYMIQLKSSDVPHIVPAPAQDQAPQSGALQPTTVVAADSNAVTALASRFCDRSARDAADYGESREDGVYRSGYSPFSTHSNTSRHLSSVS